MRRLRTDRGLSIIELASAVGASEATIRQLEAGNVKAPSFILGVRLADQLNVDARYLALGQGASTSERFDIIEKRLTKIEQRLASLPGPRR